MTGPRAEKARMRIYITGKLSSSCGMQMEKTGSGGFTLIELTMVILLLGMFLSLTIPRLGDSVLKDSLKNSSRKMIGYITELRNMAIRDNIDYYLSLDIDSNRLWIEPAITDVEELEDIQERAYTFPEKVRIIDILFRDEGEKTSGIISIRFTREGYIRPSIIHLGSKDGREFTFVLHPFLGKVELMEDHVDFEDLDGEI
jgi:prepilin-type N-terminal cleavage/methylation domain-containing protein